MSAVAHDMALFARLRALAVSIAPELREGRMFGCPALYVGRSLAACVFGTDIGLRVPAEVAEAARATGHARPFTPYGKRPMREWIALPGAAAADAGAALIRAALVFARDNDARKSAR